MDCAFLITQSILHYLVKKLKAIKNQIFLLDRTITALQLLKEHFSKIPYLDTNADILVFNSLKLPNYLKMGDSVARCFLEQVGDLILPEYFLDCSLIDEGPYEWPSSLSDIENLQEKCVLDCGANIGLFSAIATSKGFLVYAFEPIPDSQKILEKVKSLYPDKIHICPYALSDFNGRVFMSNNSDLISNMIIPETNQNSLSVECHTVDYFVERYKIQRVDFIKADIEGAERNMLIGASRTLGKFAPALSLCTYHLEDDPSVLENIIMQSNSSYKVKHKYEKLFAEANQPEVENGR